MARTGICAIIGPTAAHLFKRRWKSIRCVAHGNDRVVLDASEGAVRLNRLFLPKMRSQVRNAAKTVSDLLALLRTDHANPGRRAAS